MLFDAVKKRWLVAPLAALFLIFSGGAAIAPECHILPADQAKSQASTASTHSSLPHSHSHSHEPVSSSASTLLEPVISLGGVLSKEICAIVGFIVLLLLRFARSAKFCFSFTRLSRLFQSVPQLLARNLEHLKLTHIKLGIIRI